MKNGNRPKKSRKKLVLVLVICLAVLVLAAGGLFIAATIMGNNQEQATREMPDAAPDEEMLMIAELDPEHIREDTNPFISFVDNQIILTAADGVSDSDIRAFIAGQGASVIGYNRWLGDWQVQLSGIYRTTEEIENAGAVYLESGLFTDACPNYVQYMAPDVASPDDSEWKNWNEGDKKHWGADAINLRSMWETLDFVQTDIVKVGIMDNQFYYLHEDIQFNGLAYNHFNYFAEGTCEHGTHVAGIIAATRNNEKGIAGVASGKNNIRLYGFSFLGQEAQDKFSYEGGLSYLVKQMGCKVINISYGTPHYDPFKGIDYRFQTLKAKGEYETFEEYLDHYNEGMTILGHAMAKTLRKLLNNSDFVIVNSAGNENDIEGLTGDAFHNNYICSVTDDDVRRHIIVVGSATMSSYGNYHVSNYSNSGSRVDLIAPGTDIFSTTVGYNPMSIIGKLTPYKEDLLYSKYDYLTGTSMAAPQVTGVAAAVWSVNPELTGPEVKQIIVSTAQGSYSYRKKWESNHYPMLDASAAVDKALEMRGVQPRHPDPELPGNSVATKPRSIIMAIDNSGSMRGRPIEETRKAADRFVDAVYGLNADVAIVRFNSSAYVQAGFSSSLDELHDVVSGFSASGGTDIGRALNKSYDELKNSENRKIIVLMSDGLPESGLKGDALVARADEIKNDGVLIYTLGFFQNPDNRAAQQELMQRIASEGCHYEVDSAENMEVVFADVSQQITGERYIYIRIACPVEVLVEYEGRRLSSADGDRHQRTFYGTLSVEDSPEKKGETIKVLRLREGPDYTVHIWGTGEGTMDYTVGVMDGDGEYTDFRRFGDIPVTEDTVMESVASAGARTSLKVDTDGDGKFDVVYSAGAGSDMGAVNRNKVLAGGGLVILAAAALLLTRARKRTVRQKSVAERENRGM